MSSIVLLFSLRVVCTVVYTSGITELKVPEDVEYSLVEEIDYVFDVISSVTPLTLCIRDFDLVSVREHLLNWIQVLLHERS